MAVLAALAPVFHSFRSSNYAEQKGDGSEFPLKRQYLSALRAAIGPDKRLISALGVRPRATPELVREGVRLSLECGADGLALRHYDSAPFELLRAVGDELAARRG